MIVSATLLALVSLSAPAAPAAAPAVAYAGESVAASKGHPALPRAAKSRSAAPAVCHPDPTKGRVCRHNIVQAQAAARPALAEADVAKVATVD